MMKEDKYEMIAAASTWAGRRIDNVCANDIDDAGNRAVQGT